MKGYRLTDPYIGKFGYSIHKPPSHSGALINLPQNVAECFEREEKSDVELGWEPGVRTVRNCPLHVVFVDEAGEIVDKSYRYA